MAEPLRGAEPPVAPIAAIATSNAAPSWETGLEAEALHHRGEDQLRLHRLYQRLRARGKPGNVATVAVARELSCFLWAAAVAP